MSIFWKHSTLSGLCDRLIDLLLLATYAKIKKKSLELYWKDQPNQNNQLERMRPSYRWDDYKLEYLIKYIKLPQNVIIHNHLIDIDSRSDIEIFESYLGGIYSPITFCETMMKNLCDFDTFNTTFNEIASEISFLNLDKYKFSANNLLSVHLRRTDKTMCGSVTHGVDQDQLEDLDRRTNEAITNILSLNKENTNIYFCSDDDDVKKIYVDKYKKICNVIEITCDNKIEQTYFDLLIMSNSKNIILSQRHSNYSLLACLLKKVNLIYLYNDNLIVSSRYNELPNFVYYETLQKNNATIIGHQGYSDFFSQKAIYNKYINEYKNVLIFVMNEPLKIFVENLFLGENNVTVAIPKIHYNYNAIDTCINCVTYGSNGRCPRTYGQKCIYVDYSKYTNYTNIKLAGFDNYGKWSELYQDVNSKYSFAHSFYLYHGIPVDDRINKFSLNRNIELENNKYAEFIESIGNKKYIVIHEFDGYVINTKYFSDAQWYYIYNLNNKSKNLADHLKIIDLAEEIHIIDSAYACLIYFMCLKYNFLKNKKVYLHTYSRPNRDLRIYYNPTPDNWIIV